MGFGVYAELFEGAELEEGRGVAPPHQQPRRHLRGSPTPPGVIHEYNCIASVKTITRQDHPEVAHKTF